MFSFKRNKMISYTLRIFLSFFFASTNVLTKWCKRVETPTLATLTRNRLRHHLLVLARG